MAYGCQTPSAQRRSDQNVQLVLNLKMLQSLILSKHCCIIHCATPCIVIVGTTYCAVNMNKENMNRIGKKITNTLQWYTCQANQIWPPVHCLNEPYIAQYFVINKSHIGVEKLSKDYPPKLRYKYKNLLIYVFLHQFSAPWVNICNKWKCLLTILSYSEFGFTRQTFSSPSPRLTTYGRVCHGLSKCWNSVCLVCFAKFNA